MSKEFGKATRLFLDGIRDTLMREPMTIAQAAEELGRALGYTQKYFKCLRDVGAIDVVRQDGNALVYGWVKMPTPDEFGGIHHTASPRQEAQRQTQRRKHAKRDPLVAAFFGEYAA